MKTLIISFVRLSWLTFRSGLWVPAAGIYAVQHAHLAAVHIPAASALLMML